MGLDQYAFLRERNQMPDDAEELGESFYWRKHARLQEFMESQWKSQGNEGDFNMQDLSLSEQQLLDLKHQIENSYFDCFSEGGYFWGHQFQEQSCQEYKEQDLQFVKQALAHLETGGDVVYRCWY